MGPEVNLWPLHSYAYAYIHSYTCMYVHACTHTPEGGPVWGPDKLMQDCMDFITATPSVQHTKRRHGTCTYSIFFFSFLQLTVKPNTRDITADWDLGIQD